MSESHGHPLLVVLTVASIAPLVGELPPPFRLSTVVVELLLGIAVGPHGLGWVEPTGLVLSLADFGLASLFFQAGMEIDFTAIRGRPLSLAIKGWLVSILLAAGAAVILRWSGFVDATWYVTIALTTTAIGTLLPILRDDGELSTPFGRYMLAAGAVGEFGPVVLLSLCLGGASGVGGRSLLLVVFAAVAVAAAGVAMRARPPWLVALLGRALHTSGQLPVRVSLLLVCAFFVLAKDLGLDVILGAFAAGVVIGLAAHGEGATVFHHKLDAIGFGFLIPIFFVMSGVRLDLASLAEPGSLYRVLLFLGLFTVTRGAPAFLYRHDLGPRACLALGLYSATALPLLVAIAAIGMAAGLLRAENGAALVAAGVLSVLVFPPLAMALRADRGVTGEPRGTDVSSGELAGGGQVSDEAQGAPVATT